MSALDSVSIDWKMLTPVRPEDHLDEQIFNRCKFIAFAVRYNFILFALSRLVELNRLTLQTRQEEERLFASLGRKDPDRVIRLPSENRGGVREVYTKVRNFMNVIAHRLS